jgi:hypothetical protein
VGSLLTLVCAKLAEQKIKTAKRRKSFFIPDGVKEQKYH